MKKHVPSVLLVIICIVLAAFLFSTRQENRMLKLELDAARSLAAAPTPEVKSTSHEPEQLQPVEAVSEAHLQETPPTNAVIAETEEEKSESQRRMMGSMAKMMEENPTMNKIMVASQRGAMTALYSDFAEFLDLNTEETEYFMDLLTHRQMKNVELAMKIMGGELSDEERATLMAEIKDTAKQVKEEMKNFLNSEEDFAEYEFYEKTIGERMLLSQVDAKLSGTDQALPEDTYREVLQIMYDERNNFSFTENLGDNENMDMSGERFSQENIDRYTQETLALAEKINARLKLILTPEQFQAYKESGEAMLNLQNQQLQQAKQMFGGE